jgi:rSAM/selenodomain-associated transferase 1
MHLCLDHCCCYDDPDAHSSIDPMPYPKRLGIFARIPHPGEVKTRLVPPLSDAEACDLYAAFLEDLFRRVAKLKKVSTTVFYTGGEPGVLRAIAPPRFAWVPQEGASLGKRLQNAFETLLRADGYAVMIGSDSPDIPLAYIKRAFVRLKHRDVAIGPACDGGYYLIGMKALRPSLFEGISWSQPSVFEETLIATEREGLSIVTMPPWYDVDNVQALALLRTRVLAKRIQRGDRLISTEAVLARIEAGGF